MAPTPRQGTAAKHPYGSGPLPSLQGSTGANAPGEGSTAPKATAALPGTDVNPAGRAPARLAAHCSLATGGPGAAMRHAPFGRPRRPLGTFPRGESTSSARRRTKPPTRNRFLVVARERAFLSFFVSQGISPLRRRPKGFPLALWKPSGENFSLAAKGGLQQRKKTFLVPQNAFFKKARSSFEPRAFP